MTLILLLNLIYLDCKLLSSLMGGRRDKPFLKGECKFEVLKMDLYNCNHHRSAGDSLCSEGLENSGVEADNDVWHGQASVGWSAVARVITD
jgi:hypothetical protein